MKRSGENDVLVRSSDASSSAEMAASLTNSSPPPSTVATPIASTIISPICSGPVPMARMIRSATVRPSTTPPISSIARRPRLEYVAPREITAAIEANTGRGSFSGRSCAM